MRSPDHLPCDGGPTALRRRRVLPRNRDCGDIQALGDRRVVKTHQRRQLLIMLAAPLHHGARQLVIAAEDAAGPCLMTWGRQRSHPDRTSLRRESPWPTPPRENPRRAAGCADRRYFPRGRRIRRATWVANGVISRTPPPKKSSVETLSISSASSPPRGRSLINTACRRAANNVQQPATTPRSRATAWRRVANRYQTRPSSTARHRRRVARSVWRPTSSRS